MNKDFVTFEIAKKLEEKGFKEKCIAHYYCTIKLFEYNMKDISFRKKLLSTDFMHSYNDSKKGDKYIDAPTISQVLKWLRDETGISVEPYASACRWRVTICKAYHQDRNDAGGGTCLKSEVEGYNDGGAFEKYEEAAIAGIKYVIDNLI